MGNGAADTFVGSAPLHGEQRAVSGGYVELLGETFYRIGHYDQMPPFFISLVSSADHWLFISTTGGVSAGRVNADSALFPYETVDKITAHSELTGGKTILRVKRAGRTQLWEPFSARYAGVYHCERNLYKNVSGDKLVFEEINHDLQLSFRSAWRTSDRFGFIRTCRLQNQSEESCEIDLLDGLQNILPFGATSLLQNTLSYLLDGYKRNELDAETGLGIFALSATLTDRAEPSESLKATVAWQTGLDDATHLLSTGQLNDFRRGRALAPEQDITGKAGAYFVNARVVLPPGEERRWHFGADVNQDRVAIEALRQVLLQDKSAVEAEIEADIAEGSVNLLRLVAAADGLQVTNQATTSSHHYANVLFNIMHYARGHLCPELSDRQRRPAGLCEQTQPACAGELCALV